ncbi:filamentous hemagglutinin N-terminal domain-containing protein [Roseomonas sp. HJA6]|uniref:Filamentous hemagglutinin N-terminal domain-containing protein n=1 Tax=Roseomonas alba TaxID=2846776 RepID=A0ABS7AF89_9PROT|nr:filamentous hemagglutinin N-terminal domain-containing protein [Neoroseomonas alba]MBW6400971.1 filamentous hemagglutinin N-terminal domain-containing protein [Neoroseomonas alba]
MPRRAPARPARRRPAKSALTLPPVRRAPQRWWLLATTALLPVTGTALAQTSGPTGGQVVAGQAAIAQTANRTTVRQSTDRAAIDWQQFNVGSQHTVQFVQPNQGSWTLNRVTGPDPSVIAGRVQANGGVAIVNQSGMVFAQGAQVDVGALIASAANITNNNFMAGRMVFDGAPRPGARVENRGRITVADRGLAALVGPGASNSGVIRARLGRVALGAAETFVLDLAGDGLIGIDVTRAVTSAPDGNAALVTNSGVIEAPGGSVLLTAHAASGLVEDLVRNTGRIDAPTAAGRRGEIALRAEGGNVVLDGTLTATGGVQQRGGQVALQATGEVRVGANARIDASGGVGGGRVLVGTTGRGRDQTMAARTTIARGAEIRTDATVRGNGGEIDINSTDRTEMRGTLTARGGATRGDGGFIEVSGQSAFVLDGVVDLHATNGTNGQFLLDPLNIFIADAGTPLDLDGNTVTETPGDLTTMGGSVTGPGAISATTGTGTEWVQITPDVIEAFTGGSIILEASRQIVIGSVVSRDEAGDVTLRAGTGGVAGTGDIIQRTGANVSVNGVLSLETGAGGISLAADLRATGVVLSASGDITQTGGSIAHRVAGTELSLAITSSGGAVSLLGANNGSFALAASSASGDFALTGSAIRLTGTLEGNGVQLIGTEGAVALEGDVRATELGVAATTGISQAAGTTVENRGGAATALGVTALVSGTGDIALDRDNGSLVLRSGGTDDGAMQVRSARRLEIGSGATVSVAGAATFTVTGNGNPLVLTGNLHADSVSLAAAGNVSQPGAGVMARRASGGGADPTAELPLTVAVTGNNHTVALTGGNGSLQVLGASTTDGSIAIRGGSMTVAGAVTAEANGAARSDVTLATATGGLALDATVTARNAIFNAAGAVTQTASLDLGGTAGGRLRVRGASGAGASAAASIDLAQSNAVTELDARVSGTLAFTAAGDLLVTQARGAGVALVGGDLTVPAGQSGIISSGAAGVTVVADSLTVPGTLTAANGRTISLRVDALDLSGGTVSAGTAGTVEIGPRSSDYAVQLGTAGNPAGTLELATADLAAITTGALRLGRTTIASEPVATITALGLTTVEALSTTADLSLLSAAGISVQAALTAPTLYLEAGANDILLGAVPLTASGAGAAITLLTPGAIVQDSGGTLVAPAGTTVALIAHAPGGITLSGSGDFTLAGGLTPSGAGGERSLYAHDSISFTTTGALTVASEVESTVAGATVALGAGSLTIAAPVITAPTGTIALSATGADAGSTITQTAAGLLTTGTLTLDADGAIDLAQAANVVGTLGSVAFNESFGYRSTTGFTVSGPLAPTNAGNADITIIADSGTISLNAPIGAGSGTVRLTATTGDIEQADAGAAITAGRLEVTAAGHAQLAPTLSADQNVVGVLGGSAVGTTFSFAAAGDLAMDGSITQTAPGGSARIDAAGALTLNAGAILGFDSITLNAQGALTLRGTVGIDQATPISLVRLGAGAGITQEATGRIVADTLGIRATGDVLLTTGTNDVRHVAAGTDGAFALDTAGALATGTVDSVPLWGEAAVAVSGVLGSSVTLSAGDLTINPASLGVIGLGVHASAVDGVLTLRADRLALNGSIGAGDVFGAPDLNGTIDIAPRTLGRAVVIGGTDAGALALSQSDLLGLYARHLIIGRSEAGAGGLTVASAVSTLYINTVLLRGGGITLDGTFTLPTADGLLTLSAVTGDIVQNAGSVTATHLLAQALAGSVRLDGTAVLNQVGDIAGSAGTGEDFAFRGAGSYGIAGPGIAAPDGTVTLRAPSGSIAQALGAPITADRLAVTAAGAVMLDGGGATAGMADLNRVATLGATEGTSVTFRNADALTVEGVTANGFTGSAVVLEAPTLALAGDVVASIADGRIVLRTGADFDAPGAGTAITQTAGVIRTHDLSASAGDEIALTRNNEVTRLAAGVGAASASADSVVLRDGGTLSFTDAAGGVEVAARVNAGAGSAVQIVADGLTVAPAMAGAVFSAPGGVVRFLPFTAGATIGLGGSGDTTNYATSLLQRVQADRLVIGADDAGTLTLRQTLDLTGASAPLVLELHSGGDILAGGFALSLRGISAFAAGDVTLGTTASAIQHVVAGESRSGGIVAGGTIAMTTGGTLAVDAPIAAAGASLTLTAQDFVIANGATIATGAVPDALLRIVSTNPAGLRLGVAGGDPGLSQAEIALLDAGGGTLHLEGATITFAGTVAVDGAAAGLVDMSTTGSITQTDGALSVAALRAAAASVQLDRAGNVLPQIEAVATGNIAIATDGATTLRGTRSANGDVTVTAGSIALTDAAGSIAVRAADTVNLTATNGDITGTADLAAIRAATLNATASGAITLTGDNAVGTLAAIAGTGVTFDNTLDLTAGATGAGGTAVAGGVTLSAPSLRLNETLATGTVDLTATAGDVTQATGTRVATGTLRASATGVVTLDAANPDGTARNQIQDIDALSAGTDITLRNALALTLDLPVSVGAGRVLTLEAPALTIGDSLSAGAGGRIVLRTGSFNGGVASGGDILQTGGTISTPELAALAGGAVSLDQPANAIGALGGGRSAAGVDLGLGLVAGTNGVVRSGGFGGSASLGVTGALDIGTGGSLLLRADDFAIAAAIRVPDGTVTLLPVTTDAGIGYVLGGASGSTQAGRITLDSTELSFFPTGTPAAELILGALGVTGSVDIEGTVSLATGGATPRVNQLTLIGDGALTQAAGTSIDVAALRAIFPNGAVRLDPGIAGNRIAALAGIVAGGDVAIRGGAGLMTLRNGGGGSAIRTSASGSTITLRADDLDIQASVQTPNGTINLLPETIGTTVTLGGTGAGTLALTAVELARLGGSGETLDAPTAARLRIGADGTQRTAGDIRVVGDVPLRGRVGTLDLVAGQPGAAGGSVRQTNGSVDVATLTGTAQGDFRLGLSGNAFDTATGIAAGTLPAAGATGVIDLATAGALAATGITAPVSIRLAAGAALTAGGITAPTILLQGGAVRLTDLIQGSTSVAIESTGGVTQDPGAIVVTGLFTLNGGTIALPEDNQIVELDGLVATGPVLSLNTVLPLLVSGAVSAVGSLSFHTDQGLTVADAGSISVAGGPGTATLSAGGDIDYRGGLSTSGASSLTAGGALAFSGVANIGGALTLGAGAGMTLAGSITTGSAIGATATGTLTSTATLDAIAGIELVAGTDLALGGAWSAGEAARFAAGGLLTYTATGRGDGNVTLTTPGAIEAASGSSIMAAATLRLDAGTDLTAVGSLGGGPLVTLSAGTGAMTLAGTIGATGAVTGTAGGAITTTGTVTAEGTISLTAGGALAASNSLDAGGALTLDAGAGLSLDGAWSAGGAATITTTGALAYAAAGTGAADITLRATGAITAEAASTIAGAGTVRLDAGTDLTAQGTVSGGPLVALTAGTGAVTLVGTIGATGDLTATAGGALTTTAALTAGGDATLTAGGMLVASNRLAAGAALTLNAEGVMEVGGTWSAGAAATFAAGGTLRMTASGTAGADATLATPGAIVVTDASVITGVGQVRLAAGTDLTAAGTLNGGPLLDLAAEAGAMTLSGTIGAAGAVTARAGGTLATSAALTAGGDVALTAGGALSAANSLTAGGTLRLDAGAGMTVGGSWSAGGAVTFSAGALLAHDATGQAGGAVTLATPGAINASAGSSITTPATIAFAAGTDLLALGTLDGGPQITLTATSGAMTLDGTISATGAVAGTAGGTLTTDAAITAGQTVSLLAGGALHATNRIAANAGDLTLRAGTDLSADGTFTTGANAGLTAAGGAMSLDGTIEATGTVTGTAGGGLATDAAITAGQAISLLAGGALNVTDWIAANAGDLTLRAGTDLSASGIFTARANATLTAAGGTMTLAGTIGAGGDLAGTAGGALVTGATITAGRAISLLAGGALDATNRIAATAGDLTLRAGTNLSATGIFTAGVNANLAATGGAMTLDGTIGANGTVTATAGGALTTAAAITAGQAVSLIAGGMLDASGRIAANADDLTLQAGTGLSASGTFIAGANATLSTFGGPLTLVGTLSATGSIAVAAGGSLQSTATVEAGQALTLTSGGDMTLSTLHRAGTSLSAAAGGTLAASGTLAANQDIALRAGQAMTLQGLVQAGGTLAATADGALTQSGTVQGDAVALRAGGVLTQTGAVSAAAAMTLSGAGGIASSGTVSAGGPVTLEAGGGLSQSGYLRSGQDAALSAGGAVSLGGQAVAATDFTVQSGGTATLTDGKITAGGVVRLTAGQGATLQSFQIDPTVIELRTSGALDLTAVTLVSSDAIILSGSTVTLRGNSITTGTLDVDAAGRLTLDGGSYVIGRAVSFTAPGGITTPNTITVSPRGSLRPAVVFDTRAAGTLPDPLDVVEPDVPGLPNAQQTTQVRLPGTEVPGAFGPASTAAAGPMQIDIDAGRSAIFLLLDGGTVTGNIVSAGRLGIHGTGGSAELTGQIIDISGTPVGGTTAARFADSTRPASTGALTRYRINGCVVSSVNCVVPSQVLTIPQAPPQRIDIRLGGGAITDPDVQLPNIAEEDY